MEFLFLEPLVKTAFVKIFLKKEYFEFLTNLYFFFSLIRPEIFSELISLIITEPPNDVDETNRYKLPHVASELLCCEVPQFSSAMFQDEALLDKLYSIMEMEAPLNPLLASFFCKAFAVLLTRKSEQVLNIETSEIRERINNKHRTST